MKVIKTIKDKILFAYQLVAAITLVVLIAAAAIQVVTRYVIAQPPGWTDELARFAFVWCSALGAVVALDKGMHAGITLLEEKLPEAGRRVLKIICTILVIAMAALVGGVPGERHRYGAQPVPAPVHGRHQRVHLPVRLRYGAGGPGAAAGAADRR